MHGCNPGQRPVFAPVVSSSPSFCLTSCKRISQRLRVARASLTFAACSALASSPATPPDTSSSLSVVLVCAASVPSSSARALRTLDPPGVALRGRRASRLPWKRWRRRCSARWRGVDELAIQGQLMATPLTRSSCRSAKGVVEEEFWTTLSFPDRWITPEVSQGVLERGAQARDIATVGAHDDLVTAAEIGEAILAVTDRLDESQGLVVAPAKKTETASSPLETARGGVDEDRLHRG